MTTYATCECYGCSKMLPKPLAHRVTIERMKGRSSGSIRFNKNSTSYTTGRRYYTNQDVWMCDTCYAAYRKTQSAQAAMSLGALAVFAVIVLAVAALSGQSRTNERDRIPRANSTPVNQTAMANFVRNEEAPKQLVTPTIPIKNVVEIQNRLIQLGYLAGPADGVWGSKSRSALKSFKSANGLSSDDVWDNTVSNRLFSSSAARAPLPVARAQ
jgi:Putative peptidoglycan binding domain